MESFVARSSWFARPLLLLAAGVAAATLGLHAPTADARAQWTTGSVLTTRILPYSESVAQMSRRDLARRATALVENLPPSAIANPPEPWEGEEEEREREEKGERKAGERQAEGLFLPAAGATPQAVGTNFPGVGMQDQISRFGGWAFPPDESGAAGLNHFVQVINGSVAIYNKDTGALVRHLSLNNFLAYNNGQANYPRNGAFDPRVLFDWRSRRWFICALELGPTTAIGSGSQNHLLLAVSRTSDPTDTFDKYLLPVGVSTVRSGGNSIASFTDYPTLGVDANGVYAAVRIFPYNTSTGALGDTYSKIVATPIAPLVAPTPSMGTVKQFSEIEDVFSTPQPALNLDAISGASPAWFFATSPSSSSLVYRKLVWGASGATLTNNSAVLNTPAAALLLPSAPANGSTGALAINTADARLQSATIRNGRLWTCRTVAVNASGTTGGADRTACEWFEINVSGATPALAQNGRIFDSAPSDPRFYYFPSIMVNGQGHAMASFSGSRSSEFVGCYYAGRLATDAPGTMGEPAFLRAGNAPYVQLDLNRPPRNRWGDYSQATLDPSDDMSLWTIQEYAENPGAPVGSDRVSSRWGTRIGRLLSPPPVLNPASLASVQRGQTGVVLTFTGSGFYDPGASFPNRLQAEISGGSPSGISSVSVISHDPISVTVQFDVAADAGSGVRSLKLTNPDGQSTTLESAFSIGQAAVVQFSANAYTVPESGGTATITVNRSGSTTEPLSVEYSTADGTANAASDYGASSGVLLFGAGETTKTFAVTVHPDRLLEGDETVLLSLTNVTDGALGANSSARLTLLDDTSTPAPSALAAVVSSYAAIDLSWANHCDNVEIFEVERRVGSGAFVLLTTTGSTATAVTDNGPLTPGVLYTYRVRCLNGPHPSDYSNTVTVVVSTVQFAQSMSRVNENAGTASITVTRTGATTASLTVPVSLTGGTATAPDDFTTPAPTVTFAPGETSKSLTVHLQQDRLLEGDETVLFSLGDPQVSGIVLGGIGMHQLTVADDLTAPAPSGLLATVSSSTEISLTWQDRSDNEDGFQIERQAGSGMFALVSTTGPGVTTFVDSGRSRGVVYTYRVRAISGSVSSTYSNLSSAAIDGVQFSAESFTTPEANAPATITVTRTGNTASAVTVQYQTADGTATAGQDYTAVSGTLSFAAGQISRAFSVPIHSDALIEGPESVQLLLTDASGTEIGVPGAATLTITDNSTATAPGNLTAFAAGASRVRLIWQDRGDNEDGFRVERASGSTAFSPIGTVGANVTTFDDLTVVSETTYVYRVVAFRGAAQSVPSNLASVSIPTGGKLQVKPAKLNFSTVRVGKSKQLKLKIKNTGKSTLAGYVEAPVGPFTLVSGAGAFNLPPKKTLTVTLRFDPSVAGALTSVLLVTSTDPARSAVSIPIKAKGK